MSRSVNCDGDQFRAIEGRVAGEVKSVVEGDSLPEIVVGYQIDAASDWIGCETVELVVVRLSQEFGQTLHPHGADTIQLVRIRMDYEARVPFSMEDPNVGEAFGLAREASENAREIAIA